MKRNYKILLLVVLVSAVLWSFRSKSEDFDNPDKDKLLIELITYVLDRGHFDPKDVNDNFSENVFMDFIGALDAQKRYFLASDLKDFEKFKYELDEQIKQTDISFFNRAHLKLMKRMSEVKDIYPKILAEPFDFTKDEAINVDYEKLPYSSSKKELTDRWRKQLKLSALTQFYDKLQEEKTKKEEDDSYEMKSEETLEKEARESILKNMDEYFNFMDEIERKDWFTVYVNAIVEEFDPHTFYFAPNEKERFDMNMSGKFEGIGARLQKRYDEIKVAEIISGGPAWRDKSIEVGDIILKVAQGEDEPVDIVGMRLDDAVKLIKGPKGTEVRLTVKRVDGTIEVIPVIRDVVELEEAFAKTSLITKDNRKFGLINLPKFYVDFTDYKERNAATDVKKEIERLKEEGMEGLVIDLRDNGGGSLKTVVDMAGLFIKDGPIVQVKSIGEGKEVLKDRDKSIVWDGPLVILVNELSASASEILAAAMQDYKRAIVIGSKQTYGKGTVQNVIDLNQFLRGSSYGDVGALKLTTQKFYRVNGGSTQLEGVKSDVIMPDRYSYINIGEKDQDNPLPWDKIDAADFDVWDGYIDFNETISKSKQRMAQNDYISLIEENAKWVKQQQEDYEYPLNYTAYAKEIEENEEYAKRFKDLSKYETNLTFNSLPYELEQIQKDDVLKEKRERWHEDLMKDVYVEEAVNVLQDLKINFLKNKKLANVNKG